MSGLWFVTFLSLAGNVLNVKKKRSGFIVWIFANCIWLAYDFWCGTYSRCLLDVVQTIFCVWGLIEWTNKEEE